MIRKKRRCKYLRAFVKKSLMSLISFGIVVALYRKCSDTCNKWIITSGRKKYGIYLIILMKQNSCLVQFFVASIKQMITQSYTVN